MTRENLVGKKTTAWTYDGLGNITSKKEYDYTTDTLPETATKTVTYYYKEDDIPYEIEPETTKTYDSWNNLLLAVDLDGSNKVTNDETIEYDKIGNPEKYLGAALTWNGRQLTSYTKDDVTITYKYDANGLRTSKTINGVTSKYFYVNGQLHYEERSDGTKLYFFYDSNGYLTGIQYNDINYYPATNRRGDVVAIYDRFGVRVARYEYDAWGNVISIKDASGNDITDETHIALVNPIRYRSYYYDSETELHHLQSRYYNAEVGRFLNGDSVVSDIGEEVLGNNMFAYCLNNPVFYIDYYGTWTVSIMATGNATTGVGILGAVGVAFDGMGTFEYQYSVACPNINDSFSIGGIDAGIGISVQITRAKSVENLHGLGTAVGFSAGTGGYVGIDAIYLESIPASMSNDNQQFDGVQFTVGYGVGVDAHVNQTYTNSIKSPWESMIDTMQKFADELYKLI